MRTLARRSWEGATLYLPVILMGLLALGTWWLVRNAPQAAAPALAVAPKHEPDYFMSDFSVKNFDEKEFLRGKPIRPKSPPTPRRGDFAGCEL